MSPSRRKLFRVLFWAVLIYTALSTTVVWAIQFGLIPTFWKDVQASTEQPDAKPTQLNWSEGSFAERFTREYLWWTVGKEDSRKERLKPYLATNIDPSAGLHTDSAKYHSFVSSTDVWSVVDRPGSKGIKEVTIYTELSLTNVDDPNDIKRSAYYLVVPLMKAGNSFRVVDKPFFITPPTADLLNSPKEDTTEGDVVDEAIRMQVDQFLLSFWKVYFAGNDQELSYFVKSTAPISGYENIYQYVEMKNLKVLKLEQGYVAYCDVTLSDTNSGFQSTVKYKIHLLQDGTRWYVTQLKQGEV